MRFFPTVIASVFGTLIAITVAFFMFLVMIAGIASTGQPAASVPSGSVLVVPITGILPELSPDNPFGVFLREAPQITLSEMTGSIREAADDDRISALWVRPSGIANGWASLEELASSIRDFQKSGKPVIASSSAAGYSEKDYFVAVNADHVFSPPAASFELNGLALVLQFMKQLLEKLDVRVEAVRAGNFKSAVEPFVRDDASDENREQLQRFVDVTWSTFAETVAERRGLEAEDVLELANLGSVTSAESALEGGLIDSLLVRDGVTGFVEKALGEEDVSLVPVSDYRFATQSSTGKTGRIAVVNAVGTITPGRTSRYSDPMFGGTNVGSASFTRLLERVREDESIDAVVVRVSSPGGSAAASDVIWHAIKATAAEKPVVASMGDVAASGGYYIAAAADRVVASKTTLTGSIGVFSLLLDVSGLMEDKVGLTYDAITSGPYADMFSGVRPLAPAERAILERDVDRIYERFTGLVADDRKLPIEEVLDAAQGRVWTGLDAEELGLVDATGGLHAALESAADLAGLDSGDYRVVSYPRPRGLFEQLGGYVSTTSVNLVERWTGRGMGRMYAEHARTLSTLSELNGSPQARLPYRVTVE